MIALALFVLLLLGGPALAFEEGSEESAFRKVGVLAHRGDNAALERWQPTFDAVANVVPGVRFSVVPLSLQGVRTALSNGEIDYLFTNPGHLYRLVEHFRLSPMVALRTDRAGSPRTGNRFGAVIFARSDNSQIRTLADIKGRKFAAVAPDAFGGFEVAAATLIGNGINPWRDLDAIAFLGFPQFNVIEAVMNGAADAGTVRTGMLENAVAAGRIRPRDVHVLNASRVPGFDLALSTELAPEWVLSATSMVPEPERRQVAITLLGLEEEHPAVAGAGYGGWTTVASDAAVRRLIGTVDMARKTAPRLDPAAFWPVGALAFVLSVAALAYLRRRSGLPRPAILDGVPPAMPEPVHLTSREREILALVGTGKTTKEIARDLGISPKTVEFHRSHLMRKFDAHNMAELVLKAGGTLAA